MNKKLFKYLAFIGLIGILFSCEKEGTKAVLLDNPTAPVIQSMPDLTLKRANGLNVLEFVGTPVEPGFQASVNYYLEACAAGNNFQDVSLILSDIQDLSMKITVTDLNGILLKKFPADQVTSMDFRIRSVLSLSNGTGSYVYSSPTTNANVTLYGLPRLDLINSGLTQKIESAFGDGKYFGYVKLDVAKPFTLNDPDANISYGANGTALAVNGPAIAVPAASGSGWYQLSADTKALTYTLVPYMVGLIGDATPNAWNSPDSKMDYDAKSGLWTITMDLTVGSVKVRSNDSWGTINLGLGDATHPGYSLSNLWNNGSSQNIPISAAGNYTIQVYIGTSTYSMTITKNN